MPRSWPTRVADLILFAFGLALTVGGAILAANDGSLYYVITGVVYILTSILLWRGDVRGGMDLWCDAGLDRGLEPLGSQFLGLAARAPIDRPFVLAALPLPSLRRLPAPCQIRGGATLAGGLVAAVVVGSVAHRVGEDTGTPSLRRGVPAQAPRPLPQPLATIEREDLPAYGNDQSGTRFSPLDEINTPNVSGLTKV